MEKTDWFVHHRFGLFIHWGLYSLAARHEWVKTRERLDDATYRKYFEHFNPDLYDPKAWAKMAKNAGMKYVVITTKHHEGFCLWDTKYTDYKAPNTPAGRDLLKPMVEAFREEGLKIGFYYSLLDWHHPEYTVDGNHPQRDDADFIAKSLDRDMKKYAQYMRNQVQELLTNYGKIDIIWFDFSFPKSNYKGLKGKGKDDWESQEMLHIVHRLQPQILINNRLEIGADFHTPEQIQPQKHVTINGEKVVWEACQTLNGSWGYDRDNHDWKSPDLLLRMLIDTVSKGGNLLLNVGPNARGEFQRRAVQTLEEIGQWMRLHSPSIYGCGESEFPPPPGCHFTQNGNRLYLHIFTWPFRHIHLYGLSNRVQYAQFLHDASEVKVKRDQDTLILELPIKKPGVTIPVIELFLE